MEEPSYTLHQVANAIGVHRATLLTWAQRGYLPFLDNGRAQGEVRRFDMRDAAHTAAFAVIASNGDARDADKVMREVTERYRALWDKYVVAALKKREEFYIFVKRYLYNGAPVIEAMPCSHAAMQTQLAAFSDPTVTGEQVGVADHREPPAQHVAVFLVGSAISTAAMRLSRL